MSENEIRDAFRDGIGAEIGEEPPIVGGPAAVFAGARARTVRTRAVAGALSAVAVLGVAGVAAAVVGGAGNHGVSPGMTGLGSTHTMGVQPTPGETSPPSGMGDVPAGQVLLDSRSAAEILKSDLPAGLTTGNYYGEDGTTRPPSTPFPVLAAMSLDDGTGKLTQVSANVGRVAPGTPGEAPCTYLFHGDPGASDCQSSRVQDGTVVVTVRTDDHELGADGPVAGSYSISVQRFFPNGMRIAIGASNWFHSPRVPYDKSRPVSPSRTEPLLSADQLRAIVMDPRWGFTVPTDLAQKAKQDIPPNLNLAYAPSPSLSPTH